MSDEMARSNAFPFDQRIAEAVSMGIPVEEIAQHLSDSKNETHKFWVQQYKGLQTAERAKARAGETTSDNTDNKDQSWLDQAEGFVAKHPVASAVVGTVAAGAGGLGAYAIKSRMDTAAKIREAKALAKLEPSEAVKIQREQLDLAKQKFQAEQDALIKGETANAIKAAKPNPLATAFEEKFKIPFSQAEQFAQGKITSPQDAEIIGNAMKSKLGAAVNPMSGAVSNQQPGIPSTVNPINTLLNAAQPPAAPAAPASPPPTSSVGEAVATGGNVGQAVKQTVANLVDETPAPSQKPVYPKGESLKAIPPGFVFREDVGNLDRSLGNILGKEHREYARELFNQGKPFGHSADLNNDVSKLTNEYWQRLQSEMPESLLGRDARRAQNIQSEFGTFAKNTNFGQKAKFAGKLGTLFALSDLANAKTAEQKANAGVNLLGAVLPPGMDINDVGAPTVPSQKISQAALLGSPYAQTDWAKTQRLREKAGAGRGIAPPSAYR